jgi:hypothetical protein
MISLGELSKVTTPVVFVSTSFDNASGGKIPKGNTHHDEGEVFVQHGSVEFPRAQK